MPELPEVETVRRGLEAAVRGERLTSVVEPRLALRHPVAAGALPALVGRRLLALDRRGKVLLLAFEGELTLLLHLGMSGRLLVTEPGVPAALHEHVRLDFGARSVAFVDPRRFGSVEVTPTAALAAHPRIRSLGPEPLDDAFDGAYLLARARGRRAPLKAFLMDGRIVAGVGNIYANESCFHAGLRPGRAAGRLTRGQATELATAVKRVIARAIEAGGTTLADGGYVDAGGASGWFQVELAVYARTGQPCVRCGAPVRVRRVAQRSSFFCPRCQR